MANIFLPFYRLRTGNRKSNNPIETLSVGVIRDQSVHRANFHGYTNKSVFQRSFRNRYLQFFNYFS